MVPSGWSWTPCYPEAALDADDAVADATPAARNDKNQQKTIRMSHRFHRLDEIGAGAFGVVYRARDIRTGEIVAIKCLRSNNAGHSSSSSSAFASEVSALEACTGHPSIVQPRASGRLATGEPFLAMEFVGGPTLRHVMKRDRFGRRHTELEVRVIMRQLLSGARRMGRIGLMHRDLKPENVLVDCRSGGRIKICDLGLSCSVLTDGPPYANPVGTPGYRAPELLMGATDYDGRVDSWALGVIMAELLAGKRPFLGSGNDKEHLGEILDLLGTRDIKEWSGYDGRRLPGGCGLGSYLRYKFPAPAACRADQESRKKGSRGPPVLSEAGFEVLSGLLTCNPDKRLTARQALQLRWFKEANPTRSS